MAICGDMQLVLILPTMPAEKCQSMLHAAQLKGPEADELLLCTATITAWV